MRRERAQPKQSRDLARLVTIGVLAIVFVLAGCGSSTHFADRPRPPIPVNLTVYVSNARVSVSPSSLGAGPAIFIITNQASRAVAVTVRPSLGGPPLASTAPINPQGTSSVSVNFRPGHYTVATSASNALDSGAIAPASLHIGRSRPNGNSSLLEP
jgi:hypothetical protein